jgi:hypothetical protein
MLAMNWITPRQQGGLLSSACSMEGDVFGIIEIQRTAAKMSQEKLKIKKA